MTNRKLTSFIPSLGLDLAKYSGNDVVRKVGEDKIKEIVSSILTGGNVRSLTEGLTRRRITLSNISLLLTILKASNYYRDFSKVLNQLALSELKDKSNTPEQKLFLQWFIGLTGKSVQNVLRSDAASLVRYVKELDENLNSILSETVNEFGEMRGVIMIEKEEFNISWPLLINLFTAIGSQTLAIRGAEKSMYGKLFEKLTLGSLLTMLGFELISPTNYEKSDMVFWLSQREDKRESDATILIKKGVGVRFDIGFIGPGNTEISLDKVTRFENEMTRGKEKHYMSTIILVDRIGEGSRITKLAKKIGGEIVQMSMTYWVKQVCQILHDKTGFKHELLSASKEDSIYYIENVMRRMKIDDFINGTQPQLELD